jgi:hypothetical protein
LTLPSLRRCRYGTSRSGSGRARRWHGLAQGGGERPSRGIGVDDALEGLADAFVGTDLADDAGQLAWTLIYAALMRAVRDLLADGLDLY